MMPAMRFTIGAALLGLACAVPIEAPWGGWNPSSGVPAPSTVAPPPAGTGSIPPPSNNVNTGAAPLQSGNPFSFPLSNGKLPTLDVLAHN